MFDIKKTFPLESKLLLELNYSICSESVVEWNDKVTY